MSRSYCVRNGGEIEARAGQYGGRVQAELAVVARGYQGLVPFREQIALIRDLKSGKNISDIEKRTAKDMCMTYEHCSDWLFVDDSRMIHIPSARARLDGSGAIVPVLSEPLTATVLSTDGLRTDYFNSWDPEHPVFRHFFGEGIPGYTHELFFLKGWWPVGRGNGVVFGLVADGDVYTGASRGYVLALGQKKSP